MSHLSDRSRTERRGLRYSARHIALSALLLAIGLVFAGVLSTLREDALASEPTLREIATATGKDLETVRSQIKRAFDKTGVRRQAGMHAERINLLFEELLKGHIWDENDLKEVIGHTPLEVLGGIILGLLVAFIQWKVWP